MEHFTIDSPLPLPDAVSSDAFRAAMRQIAGTVSVVTTGRGADRTGFAATSVASLAVDPPSLLVCLDRGSSSWPVLRRSQSFCVNVLGEEQSAIADRFAGRGGLRGAERYGEADWRELETGTPALADALVAFDCVLEEAIERHSHAILIGRVVAVATRPGGLPLLYRHGSYRRLER